MHEADPNQKARDRQARYRERHREKLRARRKEYRSRPEFSDERKAYRSRPEVRESEAAYRSRPEVIARMAEYKLVNRARLSARQRERYRTDLEYRMRCLLRSRLGQAVRKGSKGGSAVDALGCSISEFRGYLESLFEPGMSWENYGSEWHIDHWQPLSGYDLSDPAQVAFVCHWSNLQPMWAADNMRKGGA